MMASPLQLRPSRLPSLLMVTIGIGLFIAVAADVTHHGKLAQADQPLAAYLYEHNSFWLMILASAFSGLGEFKILFPFAVAVGIWLYRQRRWRLLAIWAGGLLGSPIICGTLKSCFAIPRPWRYTFYAFEPGSGYTFPSGHTMGALITSGLLALLWMRLRPRTRRQRILVTLGVALLGLLVAGALVYVGVHWLTDVLGAMAISLAWLGVMRWTLPPVTSVPQPAYDVQTPSDGVTNGESGKVQIDGGTDSRPF